MDVSEDAGVALCVLKLKLTTSVEAKHGTAFISMSFGQHPSAPPGSEEHWLSGSQTPQDDAQHMVPSLLRIPSKQSDGCKLYSGVLAGESPTNCVLAGAVGLASKAPMRHRVLQCEGFGE